jgi:hypothetical protein
MASGRLVRVFGSLSQLVGVTMRSLLEISEQDIKSSPIWYFPRETDDLEVRPIDQAPTDQSILDCEVIVSTVFTDNNGREFPGYIFWSMPETLDVLKPVILFDGTRYAFWFGLRKPDTVERQRHRVFRFPLHFESVAVSSFHQIRGAIDGLGFIEESGLVTILHL